MGFKISSRWLGLLLFTGLVAIRSGWLRDLSSTSNSSGDNSASGASATEAKFSARQVVSDFADWVAIPTQQLFAKRAEELSSAVDALVEDSNDWTLKAAQSAWVAARRIYLWTGFIPGVRRSFG